MKEDRAKTSARLRRALYEEMARDKRFAAETAYVLAYRAREDGQVSEAREWLRLTLELLADTPTDTLDDVATSRRSIAGVQIPDYLHDGVVRSRFEGLKGLICDE